MKKFGSNGKLRSKLFFDRHPLFFTCKSWMNAPRICKLLNGVNKTPQFLHFSTAKDRTKTIGTLPIRRGRVFEA
jgi:hypothetical protein